MKKKQTAKRWPILISLSIFTIFLAAITTVIVALKNPVEMSDRGMQDYHHYDMNANEIIASRIAFNKKYIIEYLGKLHQDNAIVSYKVTDKTGSAVNDAKINIMITRPNDHATDIPLEGTTVENGIYTFSGIHLPKPGRWDIMANIVIGDNQRYYNLKADTRYANAFEYE